MLAFLLNHLIEMSNHRIQFQHILRNIKVWYKASGYNEEASTCHQKISTFYEKNSMKEALTYNFKKISTNKGKVSQYHVKILANQIKYH